MKSVDLYLYANCSSCKKAEATLKEAGVPVNKRDLFKEQLSADEVRALLQRMGLRPGDALSTRSRPYADLGLAEKQLSDDEMIALMGEYPALLRRPIALLDGRSWIGFNRGSYDEIVAAAK